MRSKTNTREDFVNVRTALQALELRKMDHPDEIHVAYRRLVKQWHPDQFVHRPEFQSMAEERLKQINQAYAILNEYFKKSHDSTQINKQNKYSQEHSKHKSKGDDPGKDHWVMDWLRNIFGRKALTPRESRSSATRHRHTTAAPGMGGSGFHGILRQARKRRLNGALPGTRRPIPAVQYRRRSANTRIGGVRTASPVGPLQPVPRIDPIESSE
jgi:DnaJ-class molecular chaperone